MVLLSGAQTARISLFFPLSHGVPRVADRRIEASIPSKSNRKIQIPHDRVLYRKHHKIGNRSGKLKVWRRIHTRCDRCVHRFISAIAIAAIFIFCI